MDFNRARQYIGDKGEIIKDDGVIYKTKGNQIANLFDPMSDIKELLSLLTELSDLEMVKLKNMEKVVENMEKPDYESLRKILHLEESHLYSWSDLNIMV